MGQNQGGGEIIQYTQKYEIERTALGTERCMDKKVISVLKSGKGTDTITQVNMPQFKLGD